MKIRNYEKKNLITFIVILLFILETCFVIFLYKYKEYNYYKISGIIIKRNTILLLTTPKEKQLIYKNNHLYLNNKLIKYIVISDKKSLLDKNGNEYSEVILKLKIDTKYHINDTLIIVIKDKKYQIIKLIKMIWEGDKNNKN